MKLVFAASLLSKQHYLVRIVIYQEEPWVIRRKKLKTLKFNYQQLRNFAFHENSKLLTFKSHFNGKLHHAD
jgi:hypothetical protein